MKALCSLPLTVAGVVLLVTSALRADKPPQLLPTRDVDITYVTWPRKIRERVRWLAAERLERIDAGNSTTIYDRKAHIVRLLSPANHTYLLLHNAGRGRMEPERGAKIKRGGDAVVAGQPCIDWSWIDDLELRTACITVDGVVLRLIIGGTTVIRARSVSYGPQSPKLFEIPPDYAPALVPEGNVG